jgi:hypothetical protein
MNWAIMLLGLALLGAPVAIAGENGASTDCGDDETSEQCNDRVCKENPDPCRQSQAEHKPDQQRQNASQAESRHPDPKEDRQAPQRECDDCDQEFRFISFDRDGLSFSNYTVDGRLVITQIRLDTAGEFKAERHGKTMVLKGEDWKFTLHDNPTGLLSFSGAGVLMLDFAADHVLAKGDGYAVKYDGFSGFLSAKSATLSGGQVVVNEAAQFHLNKPDSQRENQHQDSDKLRAAIEKRQIGAEIKLTRQANQSEVFTYDDMEVVVDAPAQIDPANPMRVTVSAELAEGRTIVIDVDPEALSGPELDLHYYDIMDDGMETEIVFRMADGIEDILDPTDDTGQPEYWVVKDANGIQIMASIPYWSVHAITIASIGEFVTQPSVLIGIGAGVAGVALASLTMLRPRRDDL